MNEDMAKQMREGNGFVAALDQSGGSTPKALSQYGLTDTDYGSDAEMFDLIHDMRSRIVHAPAFNGAKVIGAILFEMTMNRTFSGKPAAQFLWEDKRVVPFLKVDKGLEDVADGVQLMKPIDGLDALLARAKAAGIFGTKMRSVIKAADERGIDAIVTQQFAVGAQIAKAGLVPILEPEIDINAPDKDVAESTLRSAILRHLDTWAEDLPVMLKLTLPEVPDTYSTLVTHDTVMRVVALSGGYDRQEANARLAKNPGIIASFSRALTEGLTAQMDDQAFNTAISETIEDIFAASVAG